MSGCIIPFVWRSQLSSVDLRLRDSEDQMTFQEWRDLVLIAVCVVWYNAAFFPVAQVEAELRELALTLPADAEAKVFPFDKEIDMKLLQPMTIRRLQVLREELAAPPEEGSLEVESPAEGEPNDSERMKAKTMTFGSQSRLEIRLPCLLTVASKACLF